MSRPQRTSDPSLGSAASAVFSQLADTRADAQNLVDGLDDTAINWAPTPKSWSIGQCLEHLAVVNTSYVGALRRGIEKGRAKGLLARPEAGPPRYGLFERWFIGTLEPPPKLRMPAPKTVVPASNHEATVVVDRFLASNAAVQALLPEADQLDLARVKITSPMAKLLKLRLGAAFAIVAAHERRHLWQARNVRRDPRFPTV